MRFAADEATAKRVSDLLFEQLDPEEAAVSAFEADNGWRVEVHFTREPDEIRLRGLVKQAYAGAAMPEISFEPVAEKDWIAASLAGLMPVPVGRFVVHGSHDRVRVKPNQIGIEIEAALAFGTGHHGTTQGCLAAIDRALKVRAPRRALDVGAGTGVLAIAMADATKRKAVAGEIDLRSVGAAAANARANGVGTLVHVVHADGVRHPAIRAGAPYDFVLANILLSPLRRLARPVRALLAPGATVVLSGLMPGQEAAARAAWCVQGLVLKRRQIIDNWVTLTLERPPRRPSR
jgi:ribosomal protein L11 methyltransferase